MTAKEYLSQYGYIQQRIKDRLEEVKKLNDLRYNITSSFNSGGGAGNGASDKIGKLTAQLIDLEKLIERDVRRMASIKREIEKRIASVENEQLRTVLEKRYIHLKSLEQISVEMGYGYRHIRRLHGQALTMIRCP